MLEDMTPMKPKTLLDYYWQATAKNAAQENLDHISKSLGVPERVLKSRSMNYDQAMSDRRNQ